MRTRLARLRGRIREDVVFLKGLARRPASVGAIAATGRELARALAAHAPLASDLPILELGPGTGSITAALIERGVAPGRIVAVEYNPEFHAHLRQRFPAVVAIHGDAFDLRRTLGAHASARFAAVISGLPLLNFPRASRLALLRDALARVAEGGPFAQFSYGLSAPVAAPAGEFALDTSGWILRNLPPARVFVYRRNRAG